MTVDGVHFVGSVNLPDAETNFRSLAAAAGPHAPRLPDGETGDRSTWIGWLIERLRQSPALEEKSTAVVAGRERPCFGLPDGVDSADSLEVDLGYPHEDLAIQWDAPADVGMVEQMFPTWYETTDTRKEVVGRLARLAALVPADAELGFHLCYGDGGDVDDPEGSHWKNPEDLGVVTSIMTELTAASPRPVSYFHVPVPIRRDDVAYFRPLESLGIPDTCTLYLGLLHREDGLDGARRRITAARSVRSSFGLATECGMGRERRESIPGLLELHGAAARL